ncbi:MAG: undecaprenyldiphospho-muramoylpentapeptide beta-N-acetylglucosaminyltransferase [Chloroflexota bacterium]
MLLQKLKVIVSGGGTGGHIFPAIAIADAIREQVPEADILFVGAEGRMEMEKVPAAGYSIIGLWISGLQRSFSLKNLSFPFKVIHSSWKAKKIIREFKPNVVIGVGGYASGPTVRAAASLNIPTILQEQNSYPGITNKLLAKRADFICVAYPGMEKFFPKEKIILTGNPVRKDILKSSITRDEAISHFKLDPSKPVILSVGGSLGAGTLNRSIAAGLTLFQQAEVQVLWQTGKFYSENSIKAVQESGVKCVMPMAFINRMDMAYAASDLVISRAGAIAISELCLKGKASILVPSPNVAEDHQTRNAMALVQNEAAIMVTDKSAENELVNIAIALSKDKNQKAKLSENIAKLGLPNSAMEIASLAINCATSKKV